MEITKSIVVYNKNDLNEHKKRILTNLNIAKDMLQQVLNSNDSLDFFRIVKFEKTVIDPFTGDRENLIEVINQCHTYMVSIKAAEHLFSIHPNHVFTINFGNVAGYDIESEDGTIIAECFAATSYRSNNKLVKDLKRLHDNKTATYKYEFFYDLDFTHNSKMYYESKYSDIMIIKFDNIK